MVPTNKTPNTTQIAIRLEHELFERLEVVKEKLSRPGLAPTTTDVVRMILLAGLPVVEKQEGIAPPRAPSAVKGMGSRQERAKRGIG
ncbi:MAG: hypothetical protein QM765_47320 [Myxococcales bacterium]